MEPRAKSVLVTRAAGQGSALAERLLALGMEAVLIPSIEIAEPTSYEVLDDALSRLEMFQWLIFTSENAIQVFARRGSGAAVAQALQKQGNLRVAVIGAATGRASESIGLVPDLLPEKAVAESLAAALLPHVQSNGRPARMLLVRAEEGRDVLPDSLRRAGAEVTVAPAYRTVVPAASVEALRALFRDSACWPAAITFTSSSSARNLVALCERAQVSLPSDPVRVSIGPITSRTLEELGLPPHAEAPEATVEQLAETVRAALHAAKG